MGFLYFRGLWLPFRLYDLDLLIYPIIESDFVEIVGDNFFEKQTKILHTKSVSLFNFLSCSLFFYFIFLLLILF